MKTRVTLILCLLIISLLPALPGRAQDEEENDLLRLLAWVPDSAANREWTAYGDLAAWHASWDVPRVNSLEELEALDRDPHAYWMFIMPTQVAPAEVIGAQYLFTGEQKPFYGFDIFDVERFIWAGSPPDEITLIEHRAAAEQIGQTLEASGYAAEALPNGGTLYSLFEDYATALGAEVEVPRMGMIGALNRIALDGALMVISRATRPVTGVFATQDEAPSLAEDSAYRAAAHALRDPSLADTGELVGAILIQGMFTDDPAMLALGVGGTPEEITELRAELRERYGPDPLPPYVLTAFATSHAPGATYLTLAVVFPAGEDIEFATGVLAHRLQNYYSLRARGPLDDRWTFDRAAGVEANGLPVALVTMRIDDPPPAPDGEQANATVFSWVNMVYARDVGFLLPGVLAE